MNFSFHWNERLHRKQDFTQVIKNGRRFQASGLILWVHRSTEEPKLRPRLGLAIPRAYGGAVERNRLKRMLREVFRLNKAGLPAGTDMVFSARPMSIKIGYKTIAPIVFDLWTKAQLLHPNSRTS